MSPPGTLYIVATPLGNLEDITHRALRILGSAALVAAEDTRRTRGLLTHFGLHAHLISYREQNHEAAGRRIIEELEQGRDVALVTDAGTPVLSDPGSDLVALAVGRGIPVCPIPGPSAPAAALSVSGLPGDQYLFAGFIPARPKDRRAFLENLARQPFTLVFFEAPHRLKASLADAAAVLGDRPAVLCRELTKLNEDIRRGTLTELARMYDEAQGRVRGEITLVVAGADQTADPAGEAFDLDVLVQRLKTDDRPVKAIVAEYEKAVPFSRSELYRLVVRTRQNQDGDEEEPV
jgi:16S rRNA (cytidine1402-2'-O)-methyltransferase